MSDLVETKSKYHRFEYVTRGSIWEKIMSFSLVKMQQHVCATRCKPWDNRELDIFAGVEFYAFFLVTVAMTAFTLFLCVMNNMLNVFNMMRMFSISTFIASNLAMEVFPFVSAFLTVYKCI